VTVPEAARAMIAWAAWEHGKGTPAFAAVVMRPVELLAGHGLTPSGQRISVLWPAVNSVAAPDPGSGRTYFLLLEGESREQSPRT